MLRIISSRERGRVERLLARRGQRLVEAERVVRPILEAVRKSGDRALVRYARKLDGLRGNTVAVPPAALAQPLPQAFRRAVELASAQIWEYSRMQMPRSWRKRVRPGLSVGQLVRPLESVAAYIPGGRYPLPSTLMMTVIPAQVAVVKTILVASPSRNPLLLGTAGLLGVRSFFHMGGAQAVAAFAFGTETVPRANRIVGPGNIYVAAAKKLLAGEVGIDFVAGPTEILILAGDGEPRWIAADMLAQAEHDVDASAILLTTSMRLAKRVAGEVQRQLKILPTRAAAAKSIAANSAVVVTSTMEEAVELANRFAPEHISVPDSSYLEKITSAGSVFVGPWSPEAAGDYASGPNHVLPTGGRAALRGGLSVLDYVKIISVQELNHRGLRHMADAITTLARAEGLEAHARSVEVRLR
ncbi:MAG: histidinol dehydrogenase [Acidobacteria bacterium]|nr:histidinol dehydrogenase [Acidobacteriota bacterium]